MNFNFTSVLITQLGSDNDIYENKCGKYLVKSVKNGSLYLLNLPPY